MCVLNLLCLLRQGLWTKSENVKSWMTGSRLLSTGQYRTCTSSWKKSSMKQCQSLFRPCSQNLESFNMDWICHIGLHTARCVLGWQVENNLHWGMHTSVCGAVACRWLFPFQVFWHRGLSISLKKLNVMGVAFYNSNLCVFIPVAPGCGLLESWSMERMEGLETWDVQE